MRIAVIDIGKSCDTLGWAISGYPEQFGSNLDECIDALIDVLKTEPVALGFEAPQFVPVRKNHLELTKARAGEAGKGKPSRPFSAGAGAAVLVTSLVTVPYVLSQIKIRRPEAVATLDWKVPPVTPGHLLLWEAFVTDQRKDSENRHVKDAQLAIRHFSAGIADPETFNSSIAEPDCLNLIGAALLRTGWSTDVSLLKCQCLVVRTQNA